MSEKAELQNEYVKNFYDSHVGGLDETYENTRWHNSVVGKFDYRETSRAIAYALRGTAFETAVEIGPGDGVWSNMLREKVSGNIHLVEQSEAMLTQAKARLGDSPNFTFERSDWMESNPPAEVDTVYAIRCFEYFKDKPAALTKMLDTLASGGKLILITKNKDQYTTVNVQGKTLHSDQVTRQEMKQLLLNAGFNVEHIYPATFRWKVKYGVMRVVFDALHRLMVKTGGIFRVPVLEKYATESFMYVATKPRTSSMKND